MNNYDLTQYSKIDESQLPSLIRDQFATLEKVKSNVGKATNKADAALSTAKNAASKDAGWFKKKTAIEALQDAALDLADAQVAAAEAQEVSFEYQQALTEVSKALFALGISNIAANRCVVRELELRLSGASKEQLDDLARQEILGVVQQLKAQEDIMMKQQELAAIVKGHNSRLGGLEEQNKDNADKIEERIRHEAKQDEQIRQNSKKSVELEKRDDDQDAELKRQAKKDEEHDDRLNAGDEKDASQDAELQRQAKKDTEHDKRLDLIEKSLQELKGNVASHSEVLTEYKKNLDEDDIRREELSQQITALETTFSEEKKQIEEIKQQIADAKNNCSTLNDEVHSSSQIFSAKIEDLEKFMGSLSTKRLSFASMAISVLALVLAIIRFFF